MTYLEKAHDFVENEKPFHLGFLPTEQSNPQTRNLDKEFARSTVDGIANLQQVDRNVLEMARKVLKSTQFEKLVADGEEINAENIGKNLYTSDLPPVDLIIRPSGEKRLSNFLL